MRQIAFRIFTSFLLLWALGCGNSGKKENQSPAQPAAPSPASPAATPASGAQPDQASAEPLAPEPPKTVFKPHNLAKGTEIEVKLMSVADSSVTSTGFLPGLVTTDVKSSNGEVAIPANSPVVIYVRDSSKTGAISKMVFGLYSVRIGDSEHSLSNGARDAATISFTEDAGKGPSHSSIHLQFGTRLDFRLEAPVELR